MKQASQTKTSQLAYAFGAFGNDVFFATLSTYFIMFVTTHLFNTGNTALNNRMVGYITAIIFALRFVELLIDPFIGNTIDNTRSRFGKFKPWVVIGGAVSSIILVVLFTTLGGLNKANPLLYLAIFALLYIIMDVFYSFKDIGFWSMIPALSFDSQERERTATIARVGSTIGQNIVGVIVMPTVLFFSLKGNGGTGDDRGWFAFAIIVGIISLITAVGVGIFTKEQDSALRENKTKTGFKDVLHILSHNDQLMWLALAFGCYTIGMTLVNSLELYYFTFILGNAAAFSIFASINVVTGLISVSLFPKLADKFKRRNVFLVSIGVMLTGLVLFAFANQSLPLVLIAAQLFAIPQPLVFLVVLMILSDSVEYGQLKLGHRDESLILSIRPLLDKLAGAISNGIVGLTAVVAGMTTGATAASITFQGRLTFKIIMFAIPFVIILAGAIIFARHVTLSESKHAEIVAELEETWGAQFSDTPAESLAGQPIDNEHIYSAPISGTVCDLTSVSDPNFASGALGQGVGIQPSDGRIYAPFDGTVSATFSTRHAIGLISDDGIVTLIHIGIDTIKMDGTGFINYVDRGQHVKRGDLLIEFWDQAIHQADLDDTVMITITNSKTLAKVERLPVLGETIQHGEPLFEIEP